jgi:hypothetical protein
LLVVLLSCFKLDDRFVRAAGDAFPFALKDARGEVVFEGFGLPFRDKSSKNTLPGFKSG